MKKALITISFLLATIAAGTAITKVNKLTQLQEQKMQKSDGPPCIPRPPLICPLKG